MNNEMNMENTENIETLTGCYVTEEHSGKKIIAGSLLVIAAASIAGFIIHKSKKSNNKLNDEAMVKHLKEKGYIVFEADDSEDEQISDAEIVEYLHKS